MAQYINKKATVLKSCRRSKQLLPIRASISQTIEWLIEVGQKQIRQSEINNKNDNTSRN